MTFLGKKTGLAYGSGLHLLAFTENGELYSWGYNTYAQLGNGTSNHSVAPLLIGGALSEKKIVQVTRYFVNRKSLMQCLC